MWLHQHVHSFNLRKTRCIGLKWFLSLAYWNEMYVNGVFVNTCLKNVHHLVAYEAKSHIFNVFFGSLYVLFAQRSRVHIPTQSMDMIHEDSFEYMSFFLDFFNGIFCRFSLIWKLVFGTTELMESLDFLPKAMSFFICIDHNVCIGNHVDTCTSYENK